jgi:hypothetical protein
MKKLFGILALFVLMASSVLATDLDLTPQVASMTPTDVEVVDACITDGFGAPFVGVTLVIDTYCQDVDTNQACNAGDIFAPAQFTPTITASPTDAAGCGEVTLTTVSAPAGQYVYKVNGVVASAEVASESGIVVLVPEFTTIGAGLVLAGAGAYMYRKRSKK